MTLLGQVKRISFFIATIWFAVSCSKAEKPQQASVNETQILLQYLEEKGDMINQQPFPFFIEPDDLHQSLRAKNYLVIDIRSGEEFAQGHIENAVNLSPENLLDYFERRINPDSFEKIVILCNNAHYSGYVVGILRLLGYNNTFNLRYGLSVWNEEIAERVWLANISDDLAGKLETTPHSKNEPGEYPVIHTGFHNGYDILRARAQKALEADWNSRIVYYRDIIDKREDYYIINYWPDKLYNEGHLPGAVQYSPRTDLHSTSALNTLPSDRPLVVYCYSGHTSVYINAFLAVLGYDFRTLEYSSNAFNYTVMLTSQPPSRTFSRVHIKNYPLVKGGVETQTGITPAIKTEVTKVQGGC
jgi:rhodanese-related sulfurtransferase